MQNRRSGMKLGYINTEHSSQSSNRGRFPEAEFGRCSGNDSKSVFTVFPGAADSDFNDDWSNRCNVKHNKGDCNKHLVKKMTRDFRDIFQGAPEGTTGGPELEADAVKEDGSAEHVTGLW